MPFIFILMQLNPYVELLRYLLMLMLCALSIPLFLVESSFHRLIQLQETRFNIEFP